MRTDLNKVAEVIWEADGKRDPKYTGAALLQRLTTIMTPHMNEGFFANVTVLVEGEDDRAAILGTAKALGQDLEGKGFAVIPCGGKANIDRPYAIFRELGIPVYVIWDGDYGKGASKGICDKCGRTFDNKPNPEENKRLLRLLKHSESEIEWPEYTENTFACFKTDLETTLQNDIGKDCFEKYLNQCKEEYCISKRNHAIKNPNIIAAILFKAREVGKTCKSIENIINKIVMLNNLIKND